MKICSNFLLLLGLTLPAMVDGVEYSRIREVFGRAILQDGGGISILETDGYTIRKPNSSEVGIVGFAVNDWEKIVNENLLEILPGRREQAVFFRACESLHADEYLRFQLALLEQVENNKIQSDVVLESLFGFADKEGFLAYNFTDSRVQRILRKAIEFSEPGSAVHQMLVRTKGGELREQVRIQKGSSGLDLPVDLIAEPGGSTKEDAETGEINRSSEIEIPSSSAVYAEKSNAKDKIVESRSAYKSLEWPMMLGVIMSLAIITVLLRREWGRRKLR